MTDRELLQMALDALEDVADDAEESHKTVSAIKALRARLANEFNPDWNQVEALQESLREHMAEIQRLRARLAQPEQEPVAWIAPDGSIRKDRQAQRFNEWAWGDEDFRPLYTAPPQPEPMIDGWPLYSGLPPVKVQDERETQYKSWAQSAQVIGGQYDPRRELVGLTNEEKKVICQEAANEDWTDLDVINATEAKLREKNG